MTIPRIRTAFYLSLAIAFLRSLSRKLALPGMLRRPDAGYFSRYDHLLYLTTSRCEVNVLVIRGELDSDTRERLIAAAKAIFDRALAAGTSDTFNPDYFVPPRLSEVDASTVTSMDCYRWTLKNELHLLGLAGRFRFL